MRINNDFNLGANEGSPKKAENYFIIVHETANSKATGVNEATYMKRNWRDAYTTDIVGDGGIVYRVGEWGYISYGALNANPYAPVQIELQHTLDPKIFVENYKVYIELIRKACDTFGIPKTLDASGKWTKGVKSHKWISENWGGDHTDPYSYLEKMGISKTQFAKDIANGISNSGPVLEHKPVKPTTPSKPVNSGLPKGFTVENGTFVNGDTPIQVRVGNYGLNAVKGGMLPPGESIKYQGYINDGTYVWVTYIGYSGDRLFLPVRYKGTAWGTFK